MKQPLRCVYKSGKLEQIEIVFLFYDNGLYTLSWNFLLGLPMERTVYCSYCIQSNKLHNHLIIIFVWGAWKEGYGMGNAIKCHCVCVCDVWGFQGSGNLDCDWEGYGNLQCVGR